MTLTLLNIYNSVASQAWSMFEDNVDSKAEFENVLISSINKALSDLWCSTDFAFRKRTDEFFLIENENEYSLPDGNLIPISQNGKKGFSVRLNGKLLEYLESTPSNISKKGTPTSFCVIGENIYFYPIPDIVYEVAIDYYSLAVGLDIKGNPIFALNNDTDYIDVPQKLEELFKNALITKTMLYSIASDKDENYSNYKKQFEKAYKLLLKYSSSIKPDRKVVL